MAQNTVRSGSSQADNIGIQMPKKAQEQLRLQRPKCRELLGSPSPAGWELGNLFKI